MMHVRRVILAYVLQFGLVYSFECPFSCQCYQQSDISSISCVNTELHYIPNYFNFDVKLVNMSGNSIAELTKESFQNQHYRSLEVLDLRLNGVHRIDNKAFFILKNLLEIDLSRNQLRFVNRKMFSQNRFLNTVILSGNPIVELKPYTFPFSIYLRYLDFQGCKIEKVDDRVFVNSPMVEYINLKDNQLKSLSVNVLHNSSQLIRLLLDGNPWRCDEKLWILLKWIRDHEVGKDSLLCVYGETENAVLWDTMDVDNAAKFASYSGWTSAPKHHSRRTVQQPDLDYPAIDVTGENEDESGYSDLKKDLLFRTSAPPSSTKLSKLDKIKNCKNYMKAHPDNFPSEYVEIINNAKGEENSFGDSRMNAKSLHDLPTQRPTKNGKCVSSPPDIQVEEGSNDPMKTETEQKMDTKLNDEYKTNESNEVVFESDEFTEDSLNMNVMSSLIAIEFILLLVLLYVLYKLWKGNKQGSESGADTPLSCGKAAKTYDTNSPGYKRYSLSDDNFSLGKSIKEESKYDAESGYLSYHRHNSIEGETNENNEFTYGRRFPLDNSPPASQSLNTSAGISLDSSIMGLRSQEGAGSDNKLNIKRNSSTRSLGRRVKINPYDRSISMDTAVIDRYNLN